jgi:hypothetical protein
VELKLQPFEPDEHSREFQVSGGILRSKKQIHLHFAVKGPVSKLLIPKKGAKGERKSGLWEHSCFELFLAPSFERAYWEWNFSPSGDWCVLAFNDYRKRQDGEIRSSGIIQQEIAVKDDFLAMALRIEPDFSPELLFALANARPLNAGLCVVLEHSDESKSYWSLAHLGTRPDFHIRESFTQII